MGTPLFSNAFRIGAALTALASGYVVSQRVVADQRKADYMTDKWAIDTQYSVAQGDYYSSASGYGLLEEKASWWRRFKAFGPFNIKVVLQRWKNKIGNFLEDVNQPLGWLALTGFLFSHEKAYKAFTEPAKFIGNVTYESARRFRDVLYTTASNATPARPAGWNNTWAKKAVVWLASKAGSGGPASIAKKLGILALPLIAMALIWRKTERVESGQETLDRFRPHDPIGEVQDALYGHC